MDITLNGKPAALEEGDTITLLTQRLGLHAGQVAVECNGAIVPRSRHSETLLQAGDHVEIVQFIGGG